MKRKVMMEREGRGEEEGVREGTEWREKRREMGERKEGKRYASKIAPEVFCIATAAWTVGRCPAPWKSAVFQCPAPWHIWF